MIWAGPILVPRAADVNLGARADVGKPWRLTLHPEDRFKSVAAAAQAIRSRSPARAALVEAEHEKIDLRLHPLKGDESGRWAVDVSGNGRITFLVNAEGEFDELDYEDYH